MKYLSSISSDNCDVTFVNGTFTGDLTVDTNTLYVDSTNNRVGIGTTSPAYSLDVQGATNGIIRAYGSTIGRLSLQNSTRHYSTSVQGGNWLFYDETGGAERIRITSAGNVGIGTSSPTEELHVEGEVKIQPKHTSGTPPSLYLGDLNNQYQSGISSTVHLTLRSTSNTYFQTGGANYRMMIDSTGKVGIGTISPAGGKLHIVSTGDELVRLEHNTATGNPYISFIQSGTRRSYIQLLDSENNLRLASEYGIVSFLTGDANNEAERMRITSDGNVGIGTTSPAHKLNVSSSNNTTALGIDFPSANYDFSANSTSGYTTLFHMNNTGLDIGHNSSSRALNLKTNSTDRLTITGAGNVGIGTTSPDQKLQIHESTSSGAYLKVTNSTTGEDGGNGSLFGISSNEEALVWNYENTATRFGTNGTERMRITSSGNVGIGTASPSNLLHIVASSNNASALIVQDDARRLQLGRDMIEARSTDGLTVQNLYIQPNGNTAFATTSGNVGIGTTGPAYKLHVVGNVKLDGTTYLAYPQVQDDGRLRFGDGNDYSIGYNSADDTLRIADGNSLTTAPRIILNSSGNVGIGTTSPGAKLQINGATADGTANALIVRNSSLTGLFSIRNDGRVDIAAGALVQSGGGYANTSSNSSYFTGNLGIGTTTPAQKLHVVGNVRIDDGYTLSWGADTTKIAGNSANNTLAFKTSSADRLYINSSGNVGIGTTAPIEKLDVAGTGTQLGSTGYYYNVRFKDDVNSGVLFGGNNTANGVGFVGGINELAFITYGNSSWGERMRISATGNVGIGTTSPSQKLHVVGSTLLTGGGFAYLVDHGSGSGGVGLQLKTTGANAPFVQWHDGTNILAGIRATSAKDLHLQTNGYNTRIIAKANGNVGIGTNSPSSMLEIRKSTATHQLISLNRPNSDTAAVYLGNDSSSPANGVIASNYSDLILGRDQSGTLTEHVRIKRDGNILIGTTTDSGARLNVQVSGASLTNVIRFGDASPGYLASGTSGVYLSDSSGTARFMFKHTGEVGIGTSSPSKKLHVLGGDSDGIRVSGGTNNRYVEVTSTSIDFYTTSVSGYGMANLVKKNSDGSVLGQISGAFGDPNTLIYTYYGGTAYNNAAMYILSSNKNVGIGTTSPTRTLSVEGTAFVRDDFAVTVTNPGTNLRKDSQIYLQSKGNQSGTTRSSQWYLQTISDSVYGNSAFRIAKNYDGGSTNEYLRITSAGNVGIGTTSPVATLEVEAASTVNGTELAISNDYGESRKFITFRNGSDIIGQISTYGRHSTAGAGPAMIFDLSNGTSAVERLRITKDGNVGIGTTSPSRKLEVAGGNFKVANGTSGSVYFGSNNQSYITYLNDTVYFRANASHFFEGNGFQKGIWDNSGNLGVGTTIPDTKLHVHKGSAGAVGSNGNAIITAENSTNGYVQILVPDANESGVLFGTPTNGADGGILYNSAVSRGLEFRTAGNVRRMVINSSGNVGIGTTSPTLSPTTYTGGLHVENNTYIQARLSSTSSGAGLEFIPSSGDHWEIQAQTGNSLIFYNRTDSSYRMVLDGSGNVGIGTTSPSGELHVSNVADFYTDLDGSDAALVLKESSGNPWRFGNKNADNSFNITQNASSLSSDVRFTIANGGNVGIGTTSPASKLHITQGGSSMTQVLIGNTGTGGARTYYDASNGDFAGNDYMSIGQDDDLSGVIDMAALAGSFHIKTSGANRFTVNQAGNVGIGTTSPSQKLNVYTATGRNFKVNQSTANVTVLENDYELEMRSNGGYDLKLNANGTSSFGSVTLRTNGSEVMRASSNGNVGIGTTSPSYKLHVSGNAYINETLFVNQLTTIEDSLIVYDNVGIGTTSPSYPLHVNGGALNFIAEFQSTDDKASILIQDDDTLNYIHSQDGYLSLGGQNALNNANLNINSSTGNVGIGTSSPVYPLHVNSGTTNQAARFESSDNGALISIKDHDTTAYVGAEGSLAYLGLTASASPNNLIINGSGYVGVGTTNPTARLYLKGFGSGNGEIKIDSSQGNTSFGIVRFQGDASTYEKYLIAYNSAHGTQAHELSLKNTAGDITFHLGTGGGASEKVRITSSGNVGIGTTSPAHTLDVNGELRVGSVVPQTAADFSVRRNGANIEFGHGNRTSGYYGTIGAQGNNGQPYFALSADCESSVNTFATRGFKGNVITTDGGGSLMFTQVTNANATGQSLTERMRITSGGNVGIGTTSPGQKLTVNGSIGITTSNRLFVNDIAAYTGSITLGPTGASDLIFRTTSVERMRITSAGNVGIGTTSPSYKLSVAGTSHTYNIHPAGAGIDLYSTGNIAPHYQSSVDWYTGVPGSGTHRMRLDSSGNVGIGTTSPAYKLDIGNNTSETLRISAPAVSGSYGNLLFGSSQIVSQAARIQGIYGSSWDGSLAFSTQDAGAADGNRMTEKMRITSAGNVGIGTTTPQAKLDVVGNVKVLSGTSNCFLDVGRNENEKVTLSVNDNVIKFNAIQDSDGDGSHGFILDRTFQGTGANYFDIRKAGTSQLYINSSGNVGIGTTSPDAPLTVTNNAVSSYIINVNMADDVDGGGFYEATGGMELYLKDTSGTSRVKLTSSGSSYLNGGNVGIGTTSPNQKLEVNGGSSYPDIRISATGLTSRYLEIGMDSAVQHSIGAFGAGTYLTFKTVGTDRMAIDSSGNVGIGTTSPVRPLHLHRSSTSTDVRISLTDGTTGAGVNAGFDIIKGNGQNAYLWNYSNASMRFGTNALERMRIDSSGRVGIGTTSPGSKLDIAGNTLDTYIQVRSQDTSVTSVGESARIRFSNSTETYLGHVGYLYRSASQFGMHLSSKDDIHFEVGNTTTAGMTITSGGNVLIGNTTDSGEILQVYGDEKVTGYLHVDGDVGIGNDAPAYKLDVSGDINADGDFYQNGVQGATGTVNLALAGGGSVTLEINGGIITSIV